MANHPHIIIIIKDAEAAKRFYAELKKKLTDSLKAMLGFNYLHLWEPRPNVSRLRYFEDVMAKIAYVYANPSRADLVDSIEEYPGYSSYDDFRNCPNEVEAKVSELVPWIRHSRLGRVPAILSEKTDEFLTKKYQSEAKKKHMLIVEPNLWMKCFGISESQDVADTNKKILEDLKGRELQYKEKRLHDGKRVKGVNRLRKMAIMEEHTPKRSKNDRHIFIQCFDKLTRILLIQEFKEFAALCKQRYREWKAGDFSNPWPPGAFRPPMPPLANAI